MFGLFKNLKDQNQNTDKFVQIQLPLAYLLNPLRQKLCFI